MNRFYEYVTDGGWRAAFPTDDIGRVTIYDQGVEIRFKSKLSHILLTGTRADNFQLWWEENADVYRD